MPQEINEQPAPVVIEPKPAIIVESIAVSATEADVLEKTTVLRIHKTDILSQIADLQEKLDYCNQRAADFQGQIDKLNDMLSRFPAN